MSGFSLAAGDLDRRIQIERDGAPVHDGLQNVAGAPFVLATVWAKHRPMPGTERYATGENGAMAPSVWTIRWSSVVADVGAGDRIRHPAGDDGALYDIKSAIVLGRRVALEIVAVRRVR